jgi:signal transduction histidine kinase
LMRNPFQGIRWKMVWLFFLSALLTITTGYLLQQIVRSLIFTFPVFYTYAHLVQRLNYYVGIPVVPSVAAVILFVFYIMLFSYGTVRYLKQITDAVSRISGGDLDRHVPVESDDELGTLASHINQMAAQLKKSMEEERLAVQAKNELITNVSHDLRTPLTSIIGYLRLIEEDRYKDEVELRYYTNIAYEKSRRLERMVNDLFEYTKISYGENVLKRSDINLNELIGQLAADFSPQLADADMEIRLSFQQEKVIIAADGDMLMRALENLLSNAIKYGKHGRHIDVDVQLTSDSVHIRIINYGQSIPSSDLPQIFDRFYRVEKSRSEETGGSGIGLAIVKSIIELHQGSIAVSSTERQTVFEVTLPLIT